MVRVLMEFGESSNNQDKDFIEMQFSNNAEKEAFLLGVDLMNGWNDYSVYHGKEIDNKEKELMDSGINIEVVRSKYVDSASNPIESNMDVEIEQDSPTIQSLKG